MPPSNFVNKMDNNSKETVEQLLDIGRIIVENLQKNIYIFVNDN